MDGRKLFGQRVVELGFASEADVLEALRAQYVAEVTLGKRLFLGEVLLIQGKITPGQLAQVVRETGADHEEPDDVHGRRFFGDVAIELGYVSPGQVLEALDAQRAGAERGERHRLIGEILYARGYLAREQVEAVVDHMIDSAGATAPEQL